MKVEKYEEYTTQDELDSEFASDKDKVCDTYWHLEGDSKTVGKDKICLLGTGIKRSTTGESYVYNLKKFDLGWGIYFKFNFITYILKSKSL